MALFDFLKSKPVEVDNIDKKINERIQVIEKVIQREYTRTNQNISKWRQQTIIAESIHNPQRAELYNIYKDVVLDGHLTGLMNTILMKVQASELLLCDEDGEINQEYTDKLKESWFFDYVRYAVEARFYGHSLIQIKGVKNDKLDLELVDRQHVCPETGRVKSEPLAHAESGAPYRERPFVDWLIEIGDKHDLGVLHKATPLVLWKKGVQGAWSHYADLFGMPLRIGKTAISNPTNKKNMENMMSSMVQSSWAVIGIEDEVEFVQSGNSDAFEVYDRLIARMNSELSKLVLSQTGTTEEKAHVGSAEVHERILNDLISQIKRDIIFNFKEQVLPKLKMLNIVPDNIYPKWDNSEKQSLKEKFAMVEKLLPHYTIDPDKINEMFGIEVEEKATFGATPSVMDKVNNLYNFD